MSINKLLDAALEYQGRGWSIVPLHGVSAGRCTCGRTDCSSPGKHPRIDWTGFQQRRATRQEVEAWWAQYPNANIGLVTGAISGVAVVDVDIARGGRPEPIYEMGRTDGIVVTGSGGYHLFYKYPERGRVPNRVGINGIDVRGDGGIIVLPPSAHLSGRLYQWTSTGELGRFPPLPEAEREGPSMGPQEKWLAEALAGVGKGGRNDTCARIAGYYAGKMMPMDVAMVTLKLWNQNNDPPLSDSEIDTTVRSVYRTVKRNPTPTASPHNSAVEVTGDPFDLVPLDGYMTKYGAVSVTWTIQDWLPDQTIAFLVSPPGTFKTWLLLDLSLSVASGRPFLGQFGVNTQGPVFFIQQEDFHGQLAERLATIMYSRYGLDLPNDTGDGFEFSPPPVPPIYFHTERRLRFDDAVVMDTLRQKINQIRPRLVVIDPLYSAADTDDFMASAAGDMLYLKRLRDEFGCSFIIAHHTKKGQDGTARERLWGSQFLNAFLETGWQVSPVTDQDATVTVRRHFKVKGNIPEVNLVFDIQTFDPYRYDVRTEEVSQKEGGDGVADIMALLARGAMTINDLAQALGIHRTTVTRRLKAMEKDGVVVKQPDSRYAVLSNLPGL